MVEAWSFGITGERRLRRREALGKFKSGTSMSPLGRVVVVVVVAPRNRLFRQEKLKPETETASSVELQQETTVRLVQDRGERRERSRH